MATEFVHRGEFLVEAAIGGAVGRLGEGFSPLLKPKLLIRRSRRGFLEVRLIGRRSGQE